MKRREKRKARNLALLLHLVIYIHSPHACKRRFTHMSWPQSKPRLRFGAVATVGMMAMTTILFANRTAIVRIMAIISLDSEGGCQFLLRRCGSEPW